MPKYIIQLWAEIGSESALKVRTVTRPNVNSACVEFWNREIKAGRAVSWDKAFLDVYEIYENPHAEDIDYQGAWRMLNCMQFVLIPRKYKPARVMRDNAGSHPPLYAPVNQFGTESGDIPSYNYGAVLARCHELNGVRS